MNLANRAKALNHWSADGSGKEKAGTIKDCMHVNLVPALRHHARAENALRRGVKRRKADERAEQGRVDSAITDYSALNPSTSTTSAAAGVTPKQNRCAPEQLQFIKAWSQRLDQAIATLVVEEATPLVLASKPAFRELVDTAILVGANIGQGVYTHCGEN